MLSRSASMPLPPRASLVNARDGCRWRDVELAVDLACQVLVEQHLQLSILGLPHGSVGEWFVTHTNTINACVKGRKRSQEQTQCRFAHLDPLNRYSTEQRYKAEA